MIENSSLWRVSMDVRGIPSVGYERVLWPHTVIVALSDIALGSEDGAIACWGIYQDRIRSVSERRPWNHKASASNFHDKRPSTILTIFLLQGPKPDVAVFWQLATMLSFSDEERNDTSFECVPIRRKHCQSSPDRSWILSKRMQIQSVVRSTQDCCKSHPTYQRDSRHTCAVPSERNVSSR